MNGILTDIFTGGGGGGGLMMDTAQPPMHLSHRQSNGHPGMPGIVYNQSHPLNMSFPHNQPQMTSQQVHGNSYNTPYYSWDYSSRCAYFGILNP